MQRRKPGPPPVSPQWGNWLTINGPESVGGSFKGAGKGGSELTHEMKEGKPLAAGKEMGKGIGRAGKKVAEGVKKAVTTESDRGDREKEKK